MKRIWSAREREAERVEATEQRAARKFKFIFHIFVVVNNQ